MTSCVYGEIVWMTSQWANWADSFAEGRSDIKSIEELICSGCRQRASYAVEWRLSRSRNESFSIIGRHLFQDFVREGMESQNRQGEAGDYYFEYWMYRETIPAVSCLLQNRRCHRISIGLWWFFLVLIRTAERVRGEGDFEMGMHGQGGALTFSR